MDGYVADGYTAKVNVFDQDGNFLFDWGTEGSGDGEFYHCFDVAVDYKTGWVYVTDFDRERIQKFTATGDFIEKWVWTEADPAGIAIDKFGYVYIVVNYGDWSNPSLIEKYTSDGEFITSFNTGLENGNTRYAESGIAIDEDGYVYVTYTGYNNIVGVLKFEPLFPEAPTNVNCQLMEGRKAKLTWDVPSSTEIKNYNIYWDNAEGEVKYEKFVGDNFLATYIAQIPHPTTSWISNTLEMEKTYKFSIRSQDIYGIEEPNTYYVSIYVPPPPESVNNLNYKIIEERKIDLSWSPSKSNYSDVYNIYWDSATGTINYSQPLTILKHPTTFWISPPLIPGATYLFLIRVKDIYGLEINTPAIASIYIPPPPESISQLDCEIIERKAKLTWMTSPSDHASTYNIYWDNSTGIVDYSSTLTTLAHPTTYFFSPELEAEKKYIFVIKVEDIYGLEETGKSIEIDTSQLPLPPEELSAKIIGKKIKLSWLISPSKNIHKYNIYINDVLVESVLHPTTYWLSQELTYGTYKLLIRAVNSFGYEEKNSNSITTFIDENPQATIKIPQNGRKITGNMILIYAEVNKPEEISKVLFQYKSSSTLNWENITHVNENHPNPDNSSPYFTHWDVTKLSEGKYNLRAIAYDINNNPDPSYPR
jgi:hypothetical protein